MGMRPYLGDTYRALAFVGVGGFGGFGFLSAAMFLFRPFFEPIVRIVLPIVAAFCFRVSLPYSPDMYWYVTGYVGFLGLFIAFLTAIIAMRKPAQDRRIDDALIRGTTDFANGAPLEPKR